MVTGLGVLVIADVITGVGVVDPLSKAASRFILNGNVCNTLNSPTPAPTPTPVFVPGDTGVEVADGLGYLAIHASYPDGFA